MLKSKIPQTEQGFSFLEVIIAMLILTVFLFASLQMMVMTAMITSKARLKREANKWIEKDKIDIVFEQVENLPQTISNCTATNYDHGYAKDLSGEIESFSDSYYSSPSPIERSISQLSEQSVGFAQKRGGSVERILRLSRTYDSASSTAPHKVLRITYTVHELDENGNQIVDSDGEPLAQDYLEVIPDAALECP